MNHPNRNKRLLALQASHAELLEALRWIAQIAAKNYEQDAKLRSNGARTLVRIEERATIAIARAESLTPTNRG